MQTTQVYFHVTVWQAWEVSSETDTPTVLYAPLTEVNVPGQGKESVGDEPNPQRRQFGENWRVEKTAVCKNIGTKTRHDRVLFKAKPLQ